MESDCSMNSNMFSILTDIQGNVSDIKSSVRVLENEIGHKEDKGEISIIIKREFDVHQAAFHTNKSSVKKGFWGAMFDGMSAGQKAGFVVAVVLGLLGAGKLVIGNFQNF